MSAWPFLVDVAGVAATLLLLLVLGWAATVRGRAHRAWARLRREVAWKASQTVDWCMAMAAAAGCA